MFFIVFLKTLAKHYLIFFSLFVCDCIYLIEHTDSWCCRRDERDWGRSDGNCYNLCTGLHCLRHRCRPQEGLTRNNRTHCNRVHSGSQYFGRRSIQRRFNEPGSIIRSSSGQRRFLRELDILGGATCGRRTGWIGVREHFHWILCLGAHLRWICLKATFEHWWSKQNIMFWLRWFHMYFSKIDRTINVLVNANIFIIIKCMFLCVSVGLCTYLSKNFPLPFIGGKNRGKIKIFLFSIGKVQSCLD